MNTLLDQLNSAQRAAVEFCDGPSLVVAGAGSGKTRVLTYKIAYLLEQGLPPYYILALTFTNKAAREMKLRIAELVGDDKARRLWMGTFHSVFSRVLRAESERIGYSSNFTIFDRADSSNLLRRIIKDMGLSDKTYKLSAVINQISRAKNALITPNMYEQSRDLKEYDRISGREKLGEIYHEYQRRLRTSNSMDFDDLLVNTNILLRDNKDILEKYQNIFQFILVDEYQDTNFSQHLIIKQLADAHHRVCVVGDDAQSIYSFRGANIDNILKFKSTYPEMEIFKLERNYRSTQNIVNAANSLIRRNTGQIPKNVYSENEHGEKLKIISTFSDFEEGTTVASAIARMHIEQHIPYGDFAILYRTNAQSRLFEESLRKLNIPYRIYGSLSFYQRKEIKDIIGYFRLVINTADEDALRRVINYPTRGIGDTTVAKISEAARLREVNMWSVLSSPLEYGLNINGGTTRKLADFRDMILNLIEQSKEIDAFKLAQLILKTAGIANDLYSDITPEGMNRVQNIQELLNAIDKFVTDRIDAGDENMSLEDFLSEVALLTDQDTEDKKEDSEAEKVTIMTVHASKGLEFGHVFVAGMEEDLFPSSMAKAEPRGLEEERRLFYVAITRAEKTCTITYAKTRFRNGAASMAKESRFLSELDQKYIDAPDDMQSSICEGFWEAMRKRREKAAEAAKKKEKEFFAATKTDKKLTPIANTSTSGALSEEAEKLKPGDIIEHDRFGRGKVIELSDEGQNRRASVNFESSGQKQLLLKYIKFKIVEQ